MVTENVRWEGKIRGSSWLPVFYFPPLKQMVKSSPNLFKIKVFGVDVST